MTLALPISRTGGEQSIRKKPPEDQMACVEISGFEPELAEPKSVVLPLHHTSIRSANLFHFLQFCNINHFAICHLSIKTTLSALRGDFTTVFRRRSLKSVPSSHRLAHLRELWSWGGVGKGRRAYSHVSGLSPHRQACLAEPSSLRWHTWDMARL